MPRILLSLVLCASTISAVRAQSQSAEEKRIREVIQRTDTGGQPLSFTADRVFWAGPYKKPAVGVETPEPIGGEADLGRVAGSQKVKTDVVRIEVAKSGDLAYEFSNFAMSYKMKEGKEEAFTGSVLRVWKKDGGEWKVTAMFARPHWQPEAAGK